jgi:hypothetical protein
VLTVGLPALEAAGTARTIAAVSGCLLLPYVVIFCLEETGSNPDVDVLPGQGFIEGAFSLRVRCRVEPVLVKGIEPVLVVEVLGPGIELAAELPGFVDDVTKPLLTG